MPTLLLNYVYYSAAGHVAEALKFARGLKSANSDLQIHLVLAKRTTWEVATAVDWLAGVHPMDAAAFINATAEQAAALLTPLPREWDYHLLNDWILDDTAGSTNLRGEALELVSYQHASQSYFTARRGTAIADYPVHDWLRSLPGLAYDVHSQVRLSIPEDARAWVRERFPLDEDSLSACILLGGSGGPAHYPAARSWTRILRALSRAFPDLRLYLTGVRRRVAGRTATDAYRDAQLQDILHSVPGLVDAYDIGLWHQLALVERSRFLLSPHSGFAFFAPCVGTPWLTLSGGMYSENFYNGVPFFRVLPHNPHYPYGSRLGIRYSARRPRVPCFRPPALEKLIPQVIEGARLLLDPNFTFQDALHRFRQDALRAGLDLTRLPLTPTY